MMRGALSGERRGCGLIAVFRHSEPQGGEESQHPVPAAEVGGDPSLPLRMTKMAAQNDKRRHILRDIYL